MKFKLTQNETPRLIGIKMVFMETFSGGWLHQDSKGPELGEGVLQRQRTKQVNNLSKITEVLMIMLIV